MEDNKLVKYESGQLQKVGNVIAVTNKLLAEGERQELISSFLKNPDILRLFIFAVSLCYPLNESLIQKYQDKWHWVYLSHNESLPWSDAFIKKYQNKWDWKNLSGYNELITWSENFISQFFKKLDWQESVLQELWEKWKKDVDDKMLDEIMQEIQL